jgi:thiosulfate reductase cytochrome b subunit
MATITEGEVRPAGRRDRAKGPLIYRQSVWTRVTHWVWVICLFFMLESGLQIFNAHPTLYFGQQSSFADLQTEGQNFDAAWLDLGAVNTPNGPRGQTTVFGHSFDTTGVLGMSGPADNPEFRGFPGWATIPSWQDLATGRVVHFFFAWLLVATLLVWLVASLINRHIAAIPPTAGDLRQLPRDVLDHLRLRFRHGRQYNVLQKIAYSVVLFILFPLIVLTGLTMSPGINAGFPWLVDLFGGRQTARSIHFLTMAALVVFFVVHIIMVVLAGPINELRQMVTGRYRAGPDVRFDPAKGDKP